MAKHKFASISLDTLCEIERFRRNRSISHRVSKEIEANLCFAIFGKKFSKIPKNGGHFWGFSKIFCQKWENTRFASICLDTLCVDRAILAKSLYLDTVTGVSNQCKSFAIFGKIFSKIPKNGGHFWGFLKIFAKNGKDCKFASISCNRAR